MASVPGLSGLPMLYQDLVPLSSQDHANWSVRQLTSLEFISKIHAIPVTVDEFPVAQRFFPIVFSMGPEPVPLALMGLNEGVNVFVNADGSYRENTYLPAFIRRFPFLLARLRPDSDEMSLCFDPTPGLIGEFEDGQRLFTDEGEPAQPVKDMLAFCEQFEIAAQRTSAFTKDLAETGLLEDGELTIQHQSSPTPFTYRGFGMVNEEKLRELRGDQLRKMNQNGMLGLLYTHLFSLSLVSDVFARQMEQGKIPPQPVMPIA
ncbi:MAG TPA: SapC family protein [Sphingomonas sp.]|nr:SapC family protein [Sphingomonas sp.]